MLLFKNHAINTCKYSLAWFKRKSVVHPNQHKKVENKAKSVGLIFFSKLDWHKHVDYLEVKCF